MILHTKKCTPKGVHFFLKSYVIVVIPIGFEPMTYCLEGSCSIQLSYGTIEKSGWQDSNLRPPAPKAGAMTGLRYIPIKILFIGVQR